MTKESYYSALTFIGDESGDISFSFPRGDSLIQHIPQQERQGAALILDEFDRSGKVINGLRRALRVRAIPGRFKRIVTRRSKSEPLVQVADLVAGATLRKFSKGQDEMLRMIKDKYRLLEQFSP